ncbi:MAG: hypothetical protein RM338_06470 [Nostoc sp. DedQUE12a]|nr:hypothetical protein [Nostoc sp. DedQUE12a]
MIFEQKLVLRQKISDTRKDFHLIIAHKMKQESATTPEEYGGESVND